VYVRNGVQDLQWWKFNYIFKIFGEHFRKGLNSSSQEMRSGITSSVFLFSLLLSVFCLITLKTISNEE